MADTPTLSEIQDAIIQSGAEWEAAENPISQLSENEQRLVLGLQPPLGEPTLDEFAAMPPLLGAPATPSKYDLRNVNGKNYITAIRDQSTCGSCVAFGCLATIEGSISWVNDVPSPVQDLSEAHLYFCHGASQQVTCASGWWPAYALAYCISPGVVDESCFSYTPHDQPCNLCSDWKKRLTKIRSINGLTAKPDDMKKWISTKGPLVVGMVVFEDFYRYTSGVYRHVIGNQVGGHCVSLIGYDDGRSCWIAKNSWGTRWGEKGFFNIRYGECSIETMTVTGVVPFIAQASEVALADVTVDLSKGVQEARVKPGDTLTVCLEESPTTGFMWALQDSLPPEMNYVRDEFTPAQSGLGGAGRRCFIYVCRGEFTGELGYALRRPWIPDEIANELRVRITCTAS